MKRTTGFEQAGWMTGCHRNTISTGQQDVTGHGGIWKIIVPDCLARPGKALVMFIPDWSGFT
jgi:hypothetical protein